MTPKVWKRESGGLFPYVNKWDPFIKPIIQLSAYEHHTFSLWKIINAII